MKNLKREQYILSYNARALARRHVKNLQFDETFYSVTQCMHTK